MCISLPSWWWAAYVCYVNLCVGDRFVLDVTILTDFTILASYCNNPLTTVKLCGKINHVVGRKKGREIWLSDDMKG